jgi:hypothetical protein
VDFIFCQKNFQKFPQMAQNFPLIILLLSAVLLAPVPAQHYRTSRAKRFAGFGGPLSTVGGNLGCVVSVSQWVKTLLLEL